VEHNMSEVKRKYIHVSYFGHIT